MLRATANLTVCCSVMYARRVIFICLVHAFAVTAHLHNYLSADFMRRLLLSVLADSPFYNFVECHCLSDVHLVKSSRYICVFHQSYYKLHVHDYDAIVLLLFHQARNGITS